MNDNRLENPLNFARIQLDLVQRQAAAINQNEFSLARSLALQLQRNLPLLTKYVKDCQIQAEPDDTAQQVFALAVQTKDIHRGTLHHLTANRDRLARLLKELRRGQQMITQYHSGGDNPSSVEIRG